MGMRIRKLSSTSPYLRNMTEPIWFEQIEFGMKWRSQSRTVTETDIVNFACMTGDFNPLHVDHVHSSKSMFGRPIAHGLLGLSWVAGLGSNHPNVQTLAFAGIREWHFLKPVYAGDTVHVVTEVKELLPSGRRAGKVAWLRQLVNHDEVVVQEGIFDTIVARQHRLKSAPLTD